jgi:Mor family transcriptional regulator
LEIGTQRENIHDAIKYGSIKRKLDWEQVKEIRSAYESGEKIADLARKYGVVYKTLQHIVLYRKWKTEIL